jgi:hypothetical protein
MPGLAGANLFVGRIRDSASRISRHHGHHALELSKDCFGAPEASAAKDRDFGFLIHADRITEEFLM